MRVRSGPVLAGVTLMMQLATTWAARLEVGQPFPTLRLPALQDGHPLSIADFRGRKLMVHVWASW